MGRLAFVCQGLLYVLDGDAGELIQATNSGVASQPAWSHDGDWLAFMKAIGPQEMPTVWLTRQDGTQAHQVREAALGSQFSWSPAEDVLAVYGQSGIWLVPVDDKPIHLPDGGLDWSPDGKSLAYSDTMFKSPQDRSDTLYTIAIDTGKPEKIFSAPFLNGIIIVGWWPDGKGLLYSLDPDYSASIMADGLNLWSLRLGGEKPRMLLCGLHYGDWLSMSPHGDLLMVSGSGREVWANKNLAIVNVKSGSTLNLKNPEGSVSIDPSLSPDGRRIAFVAAKDLGADVGGFDSPAELNAWVVSRALWVENVDGTGAHPLTSAGQGIYQPLWSKDGSHILYVKDNYLYMIAADGGDPEQICGQFANDPLAGAFGYYGFISYRDQVAWFQP